MFEEKVSFFEFEMWWGKEKFWKKKNDLWFPIFIIHSNVVMATRQAMGWYWERGSESESKCVCECFCVCECVHMVCVWMCVCLQILSYSHTMHMHMNAQVSNSSKKYARARTRAGRSNSLRRACVETPAGNWLRTLLRYIVRLFVNVCETDKKVGERVKGMGKGGGRKKDRRWNRNPKLDILLFLMLSAPPTRFFCKPH